MVANKQMSHAETIYNGGGDGPKNHMHLMDQQPKVDGKLESLLKINHGPFNEAIANKMFQSDELDSIFMSSLMNQKMEIDMKPVSEPLFQQPPTSSGVFTDRNILNGIDLFNMTSKSVDELETSPQRSVPLYLRKTQKGNFE